ncbi:hypothetical protein A4A49_09466 [Nicotiana attenuata]|uniref:Uncharacterized protein n=1 Tax=Nicotiana attenuata TaxID=49451 RepID=A0A314KX52_NICAT|nr:hypothetical protein A4A49_09466 [Nicotiana attenuata]
MQARKNKYQSDRKGYIIEDKAGKEVDKGKEKTKFDEFTTKNKFNALEVEEVMNPPLQITEGKGEDHNNDKKKNQGEKQSMKNPEKGSEGKNGKLPPNPNTAGKGGTGNSIPLGEGSQVELERVKKEAVEKVLEKSSNPTPSRIQSSGDQDVEQELEERVNKESTIEWVHRRFGTNKEDLRKLNVTTNHSTIPLWSDEVEVMDEQQGLANARVYKEEELINQMQKTGNTVAATVNPSSPKTRADCSLSSTDLQPGKSIGGGSGASKAAGNQDGSVAAPLSIEKANGTEKLGDMITDSQQLGAALTPYEPGEQAIVERESEALPMACSSGTDSPLQIKINVPLKSPNQVLHDIITHQELPLDIHNSLVEQQNQFEEEGDDESTAENLKGVMREGDVSPTAAVRSGKKGKKNQSKELLQPTRILPKRATSGASR